MDFKKPDYNLIFERRAARLEKILSHPDPGYIDRVKAFYRTDPVAFIMDWGITYDPRLLRRDMSPLIPFVLFPRQEELAHWVLDRYKLGEDGLIEKSRDMGISWVLMSVASALCLFNYKMSIGCGSRVSGLVDTLGDPDSLFEKVRIFMGALPVIFRGGWKRKVHSGKMKIIFPETGSIITGEGGDDIGRGGRQAMYIVDEAAHLEHPQMIEKSLSATTDCRIDLSSVNGMQNPFAIKAHSGDTPKFRFHWRDDPRKSDEWYAAICKKKDAVTVAQEYDINYSASVFGILIPSAWVQSAIDAHLKLGIVPTGAKQAGLDVADQGIDLNAFAARHGVKLTFLESWSGADENIFKTTQRAFNLCDKTGCASFQFDSDGLGAGVRGDSEQINSQANRDKARREAIPYRGSSKPVNPEEIVIEGDDFIEGRTNDDYFANRKAQAWFALRRRFETTHWAIVEGRTYDPDDIISIPSDLPERVDLVSELSQPTYSINNAGKIVIDKAPDGAKSPNRADAVVIVFAPQEEEGGGFFGV